MQSDQKNDICMLSFDIEDWFQVERFASVIAWNEWDDYELRVQANVESLLSILRRYRTQATFFVLGWIAKRVPSLISMIQHDGHEIASHGYGHQVLSCMSESAFEKDILRSKEILEDLTGKAIIGYRAPSFSIREYVPKVLNANGFRYDSSLFPSSFSKRYGTVNMDLITNNLSVGKLDNGLIEVPVSTLNVLGKNFPWGGGGYFRFYPSWLFKKGIRVFLKRQNGYLFYGHPWDLDPDQPRVESISRIDKFLHYSFLSRVETKLEKLLSSFQFVPILEGLKNLGLF